MVGVPVVRPCYIEVPMYFPDLTPYSYRMPTLLPALADAFEEEPWLGLPIVNIGWLEPSHQFSTGAIVPGFLDALDLWMERYKTRQTRGFHTCGFCVVSGRSVAFRDEFVNASTEFRVRGVDRVYASPYLLRHYVLVHDYLPPGEFCNAVLRGVGV